jgi:hypothetical protein
VFAPFFGQVFKIYFGNGHPAAFWRVAHNNSIRLYFGNFDFIINSAADCFYMAAVKRRMGVAGVDDGQNLIRLCQRVSAKNNTQADECNVCFQILFLVIGQICNRGGCYCCTSEILWGWKHKRKIKPCYPESTRRQKRRTLNTIGGTPGETSVRASFPEPTTRSIPTDAQPANVISC